MTFQHNHREVIAGFDLFAVPTLSFRTLYCFFVIEHGRRRILAFNCTADPTASWIVQQIRRLIREYLAYYHEDRTHTGLEKSTPSFRPLEPRSDDECQV